MFLIELLSEDDENPAGENGKQVSAVMGRKVSHGNQFL